MTITADVNQQLFGQRRASIDSGAVNRRDDGTWVYADKSEVFGKEGLDTTLGTAALYTTTPAWHGLGVTWESAGALRQGRRVFVSMKLPGTVTIDAGGICDEIIPFIAAINSHDGSSAFQVVATPWRPVCANTERFAVRDAYTRWAVRHTASAPARVDEARRSLGLSVQYYEKFTAEETALARTELAVDDFRAVLSDLWPLADDATSRQRNAHGERENRIHALYTSAATTAGCRGTAYGAERAITEYLDHAAPKRALGGSMAAARATAVMEGTADDIKSRAHARLMRTVR